MGYCSYHAGIEFRLNILKKLLRLLNLELMDFVSEGSAGGGGSGSFGVAVIVLRRLAVFALSGMSSDEVTTMVGLGGSTPLDERLETLSRYVFFGRFSGIRGWCFGRVGAGEVTGAVTVEVVVLGTLCTGRGACGARALLVITVVVVFFGSPFMARG